MSSSENRNLPENSETDNPIQEIVSSLREREEQRQLAIELAWKVFDEASTEEERNVALKHVIMMIGVLDEYKAQFPEVFRPQDEN